jgi:hypothetical protein
LSATCDRCFSPRPPVFSINITDRHDIAEIFLKVKHHQANKQQHLISVRLHFNHMLLFLKKMFFFKCTHENALVLESINKVDWKSIRKGPNLEF